ncbi:MAG TPA: ElyC/SanA/YdcF family protein [Myxococcota bacterium]|nr:ElyC/SanA/YdcF family protein [Myxococcota bacterium]
MMPAAVLVLGKELRLDAARGQRELRARAAAAAAIHRATGCQILTLEARMRGQTQSGARLVCGLLEELGVPGKGVVAEERTRSTRAEVQRLAQLFPGEPVWLLTAVYHQARCRSLVAEAGLRQAGVYRPEDFLGLATEREKEWIVAGIPDAAVLEEEGDREQFFARAERLLRPLPLGLRGRIEVAAGELYRGLLG